MLSFPLAHPAFVFCPSHFPHTTSYSEAPFSISPQPRSPLAWHDSVASIPRGAGGGQRVRVGSLVGDTYTFAGKDPDKIRTFRLGPQARSLLLLLGPVLIPQPPLPPSLPQPLVLLQDAHHRLHRRGHPRSPGIRLADQAAMGLRKVL